MIPLYMDVWASKYHGYKNMDNKDTREFEVSIIDPDGKPWKTEWETGVEELVQYIRDCCERYGMENSDPDPDAPFFLTIERIPKSDVPDTFKLLVDAVFGPE